MGKDMNDTITLPKIYAGIAFGEYDSSIKIVFSGIDIVFPDNCSLRYGCKDGKNYVVIDSYPFFADLISTRSNYTIECTVSRNGKSSSGSVWKSDKSNFPYLGFVIIALEHSI